jgi:hypothetical protein
LSLIFNEIGLGGILWLLFLAGILLFPGLALLGVDRAARLWAGSEALGLLIKTIIVGIGLVLLGFFALLGFLMEPLGEQRRVLFILFAGLIFGAIAVLLAGQIIFAVRRGRTWLPPSLGAMVSLRSVNENEARPLLIDDIAHFADRQSYAQASA